MTERSAQPSGPPPSSPPKGRPTADRPAPKAKTARREDTGSRAPITEKIQKKLTSAAEEHRANAQPAPAGKPQVRGRGPRRARLRLTRVDPWSVMKTAFLLSIAFGIVTIVSVLMVWSVLDAAGVWESINTSVRDIVGGEEARDFDVESYVGTSRVVGFTMLIAVVDVILLTAIATLGAFLYNMAAALLGGIEVTLAEDN